MAPPTNLADMTFADDDTGSGTPGPSGDHRGPRDRQSRRFRAGAVVVAAAVAVPAVIALTHTGDNDTHRPDAAAIAPTVPAPSPSPRTPSAAPSPTQSPSASPSESESPSASSTPSRTPSSTPPASPSRKPSGTPSTPRSPSASASASASTSTSTSEGGRPADREPAAPAKPLYRVATHDRVAFLTIDDGAYRDPEMTTILRDAGIAPTLFLTDEYAERDPGFFRDMRDATGGSIQNHTLDHPVLKGKSYERQKNEICGTSNAYERDFGNRPTLLRPPYGEYDATTMRAAADCGVNKVVHWSAEIKGGDMQFAVGDKLRSGDIVLMHFRKEFKADIAAFVDETRRAGLTPALLDDYLA